MLGNFRPYDSRIATHLAGGAGSVQFKEAMMRQKWGLIRAVSVAALFSTVCILNNGSRAIHTLLEIPATGPAPTVLPVNEATADDEFARSKPDAASDPETQQDDQAEVRAGEPVEP